MLLKFVSFSLLLVLVAAVDESSMRERKTEEIDPDVDAKWMGSIKKWYIPMWSKLDRARAASDLFGKIVSDLTLEELSTPACMIFDMVSISSGFNRTGKFVLEPILDTQKENTMLGMKLKGIWIEEKFRPFFIGGTASYKMTDNKSFILLVGLWDDGEASWAVISTKPEMEDAKITQVLSMVKGLGFMEKNFVMESYSGCNDAAGSPVL